MFHLHREIWWLSSWFGESKWPKASLAKEMVQRTQPCTAPNAKNQAQCERHFLKMSKQCVTINKFFFKCGLFCFFFSFFTQDWRTSTPEDLHVPSTWTLSHGWEISMLGQALKQLICVNTKSRLLLKLSRVYAWSLNPIWDIKVCSEIVTTGVTAGECLHEDIVVPGSC